ncbi:hypothetical protein A1355_02595 [Methylomonas koyamae]|uniref:Uncharacterized protein n=1 Tax=Methylomonas koyamae TaxID=702114 RepID=A0A177NTR8_9GAMM|nr:hypothetical protein A1355_02595 [Methylomonas koyamae]
MPTLACPTLPAFTPIRPAPPAEKPHQNQSQAGFLHRNERYRDTRYQRPWFERPSLPSTHCRSV